MVIQYWSGADDINVAAWITIIILVILCFNIFTVAIYGEAEFIFASIKLISIVGLLLFAFIIDLGGGPTRDRLGFRYWKNPGAMKTYISDGSTGRFLGFFSTLVNAAFAYGGVEIVRQSGFYHQMLAEGRNIVEDLALHVLSLPCSLEFFSNLH